MTDWKLINQAFIGINWLKTIDDVENCDKTLRQLIKEKESILYLKDERILNVGVLIMASFILFVYPREKELDKLDFTKIDISKFKITYPENMNMDSKKLCRRLRNSISHANFNVKHEMNIINFHDENPRDANDKIDFEIGAVELGEFIDNFIYEVDRQNLNKA